MRKVVLALALVGTVVVVGGVLARPALSGKTANLAEIARAPVAVPNGGLPTVPRPLEAPAGFRAFEAETKAIRAESPFTLTASDGTGLVLAALDARAVIEGPLAFTELRMIFDNPENRVLEGRFQITLPTGASVSRFAMRIGNEFQEGEVVEKKRARRAYEDFLHKKQDPALLEQGAGNEFTARVFPIPARGRKEIILSYSTEVTDTYTLPLRGLSRGGAIDVRATSGSSGAALGEQHIAATHPNPPGEDFVVRLERPRASGLRNGNLMVTRVVPHVDTAPDSLSDTLILIDTSASRGLGFDDQVAFVGRLVASIAGSYGSTSRVSVACFDQSVEPIYEGEARGFGDEATAKMKRRGALGASNLAGALTWAKDEALAKKYTRVVLLTDGVATAGSTAVAALKDAVLRLTEAGVQRLDAIAEGGIRDDAALHGLVTAGLARDGVVISSTASFSTLGRKLTSRTQSGIAVSVEGASWVYPSRLDGVQPGDEVLVYAEVAPGVTPRVALNHPRNERPQTFDTELAAAERPLLERAWAKAKIASLTAKLADTTEQDAIAGIEREIVAVSTKNRVVSAYTSLLVLETEQDFRRFDIDRKALSAIMTVEDGRLATVTRSWDTATKKRVAPLEAPPLGSEMAKGPPGANPAPNDEEATRAASPRPLPAAKSAAEDAPGGDGFAQSLGQGSSAGNMQATSPIAAAPSPAMAAPAATMAAPTRRRGAHDVPSDDGSAMLDSLRESAEERPRGAAPYTGTFKSVMDSIAAGRKSSALETAAKWHAKDPGDVMALVALGEAWEATGEVTQAARAYGSIIDLFSSRADLRRFAGERLDRLKGDAAIALAIDTYEKAAEDRPDHPSSHRLLAFAHVRNGAYDKAFAVLEKALGRQYPNFAAADRILREDLGIIAKAWAAKEPEKLGEIKQRLSAVHASLDSGPSLRFVLNWETDANDVDFHIYDSHGGHAYFQSMNLPSGGDLYADVTTGYGPECFAIRKAKWERDPVYTLQAHYYSRGPMGYGMGKLQVIDHDGKGGIHVEDRPFVVMADQAFVNLGVVRR